ncbi:hypothetical protein [Niallia circulans]|uniref:hypothetical protein n=1 Tax=Niallia circulans TaxID=1397 RepID=UPI0026EC6115|nr:hypothetical protein [Niallia circulans]
MAILKYEFKDASPDRKQEMLSEIISKYNISNRNELIQALGHVQAVLDCNQDEFASHPAVSLSTRMLRTYKKDYLDLYTASFERYSDAPDLKDVNGQVEESALEETYQNLIARLKSPKTSTKDIAIILEYFGITKNEFKKFTDFRNATMRGFMSDNLSQIITDGDTELLVKALIAESPYLYQGTEKTVGNTYNAQTIDLDNPLARLEVQTLGLLFMSLFNGHATEAFVNHAQTLRLLKLASEQMTEKEMQRSHNEFDKMDGKIPPEKPLSPEFERELIDAFGDMGKEMFDGLVALRAKADKRTAIKMPKYEDVQDDYLVQLKVFPERDTKPIKVLFAKLDAKKEKLKDKYRQFINEIVEE